MVTENGAGVNAAAPSAERFPVYGLYQIGDV